MQLAGLAVADALGKRRDPFDELLAQDDRAALARAVVVRGQRVALFKVGELVEARLADTQQLHHLIRLVHVLHEHRLAQQRDDEHACAFVVERGRDDDDLDILL